MPLRGRKTICHADKVDDEYGQVSLFSRTALRERNADESRRLQYFKRILSPGYVSELLHPLSQKFGKEDDK